MAAMDDEHGPSRPGASPLGATVEHAPATAAGLDAAAHVVLLQAAYPPNVMSVGTARLSLEAALRAAGLDQFHERARLVLDELVWNVVLHTGTDATVDVSGNDHHVLVEVADGSSRGLGPDGDGDRGPVGHGLAIVGELADAWGWRPTGHGKVVWARLDGASWRASQWPGPGQTL
jgi:anti-sigma regulatory factor (Ser/Thr protein kinase)